MPVKARDIFLALESNAVAPDEEFHRFEVGSALNEGFISLQDSISEMVKGALPSKLQVIAAENGNGKTLLSNKITRHLSDLSVRGAAQAGINDKGRDFSVLYSHISALGQTSSRTCAEIAAGLRRSQFEEPGITYSLIAAEIAREFQLQYQPSFLGRLVNGLARGGLDLISAGFYGALEDALRAGNPSEVVTVLDRATDQIKRRLGSRRRKRHFVDFLGELNQFDTFTKTYFYSAQGQSVSVLRASFLAEINSAFQQPKDVIEQLGLLARKIGSKAMVIIIDDCNQAAFVDQLLPLINDLPKLTEPRIFLIVSMVEQTVADIKGMRGDKSMAQRLFHNPEIRLPGPTAANVRELYDRLRALFNEAYKADGLSVGESNAARTRAVRAWSQAVSAGNIDSNYRSASHFLARILRDEAIRS